MASWILDHPRSILFVLCSLTLFLGYWAAQVKTDHRAGHFVDTESQTVLDFQRASEVFGQSQTFLYVVFKGADPYDPVFLQQLDRLVEQISTYEGVEHVLSLTNVPLLVREDGGLTPQPLYRPDLPAATLRERLEGQPFLQGLLLSQDGTTPAMIVKIEEAFNDTPARIDLVNRIQAEAGALPGDVALAGFPYLRTMYAERVSSEAPRFTLLALFISLLLLYLTFRDWRAVLLPTLVVGLGITWTVGLIALFDHRLNIVTAVLPALIVIIGMATTIHLCTKFYDEYTLRQDRRVALIQTVQTVGLATFLACLTTAVGFAVLMLSGSHLLSVFGQFASAGIMLLFLFAITLIPIAFLKLKPPTWEKAALATYDRFAVFFDHLALFTQRHRTAILGGTVVVALIGLFGVTRISTDIFVFSDFYEDDPLRQDLAVFEQHFGGVLPLEVVIEAETPGQFRSLGNLRRLEGLQRELDALEPVTRALSAADLVKLANQAYFGGNPALYRLPSSYELPFLQSAIQGLTDRESRSSLVRNLPLFVDSTFTITRIYLGVGDIGTARMNVLADSVQARAAALFPEEQFDVMVTGTAVVSTRSGESLVKNLIVSLGVAFVVISVLMAFLFRSLRLTVISLVPNLLPLLLVGGAMGFTGIALKPSTALIFSLAFGIAVDATIHFLAKYRLLGRAGLEMNESIRTTLRETGKAILFNSLVLMAGFLVFTLSGFGGTVAMGGLTALTLTVAGVANLVLLPALLYRFGRARLTPAPAPVLSRNGTSGPVRERQP